jgi:hypothetical protein
MAIDYTPMLEQDETKAAHIVDEQNVTFDVLRQEVNRLYDAVAAVLDGLEDADISFEPYDPDAYDKDAATEEEKHIGWTLGHLVAHITATNEENALFTSLLARGIQQDGRIRTEVPWQEVDTVEKAVGRLEESRRIVLAYLDAIPDEPDLATLRPFSERAAAFFGPMNALASMIQGLGNHAGHLDQFADVRSQALTARERA